MIDDSELFRIHFWRKLETKLGTIVPIHVKNICKYNSLDNPLSFRNLNEIVLDEVEKFVQTELLELISDRNENLENYFGFYHKKPDKFKFTIGEKFLLLEMAEFVRSKSKEFFAINTINNTITTENVQKKVVLPINIEENMQNKSEESFSIKESNYMSDESDFFDIDNTTDTFPSSPAGTSSWEGKTENATSTTGNDEVKKLTRQVRTMVKSIPAGFLPDVSRRLKNLRIDIEKIEKGNLTYLQAIIACPICASNINCNRTVVEGSRWKMTNFSKHIKTHCHSDDKNVNIKNEPWS